MRLTALLLCTISLLLIASKPIKEQPLSIEIQGATIGISIIDLSNGQKLVNKNHNKLITPASVLKVITTATALEKLSPDFRFVTSFYINGDITEGNLNGDLIIRGGGDGTLGSEYFNTSSPEFILQSINRQLKAAGIESISGDIIIDMSIIPEPRFPAGRLWEDMANYYGAPPSGLSWRDNTFHLTLQSPNKPGEKCKIIETIPILRGVEFTSYLYSATHNRDSAYIYGYPGLSEWEVRGSMPANRSNFVIRGALPYPGLTFAQELSSFSFPKLNINIIDLTDKVDYQNLQLIYVHESPPLHEVIQIVNQRSHNLLADHLFLINGLNAPENHSIWDLSAWNLKKYWEENGIEHPIRIHDGSGLSPKNLITPEFITEVLQYMHLSQNSSFFEASLAVSGGQGTLRRLWATNDRSNRVIGKSGFMQGILGYSGYIYSKGGRKLAFCIIVNNFTQPVGEVRNLIEQYINHYIDYY